MEGRSSILANTRYHQAQGEGYEGYPGILELAPTAHEDALVSTTVML